MTDSHRLSIRSKLTRVILLTGGLVVLIAWVSLTAFELLDFRRAAVRDLQVVANILAANTRAALVFQDEEAARETLAALQAEQHIRAAFLLDAAGQRFSEYRRTGLDVSPVAMEDGYRFENGILLLSRPVVLGEKRIGTIQLHAGLGAVLERLFVFTAVAGAVLFGSLGLALAVSSRLQRPITDPILQLAETARAVAERKDYGVRPGSQDLKELAILTDAFNEMLTAIEERENALRTSNDSLVAEIVERARAEAEAQESEARYRTLFVTLNEGFCTIEVIFDPAGKPVDYRLIEINPAFERQTGLKDAQGKLIRELAPGHEDHWFERYGRVALTGESVHFENEAKALGRHFDVLAYRMGGGESRKVAVLFNDITERRNAELSLQAQLARLELLRQITRAIGDRQDLRSIFQAVLGSLEEHLPVDFSCICLYEPLANMLRVGGVGTRSAEVAAALGLTPDAGIKVDRSGLAAFVGGRLVYEPDLTASGLQFPRSLAASGLRAIVVAPMLVDQAVFGILIAAREEAGSFSSAECEFLTQVSDHTALAAHQTKLHGDLRAAYNELRETQQAVMQQERLRAMGQMASGIAHDINNAISPVSLYTEALLETEPLSPRAREYLTIIQRSIDDVSHTVSRMREFYRHREAQLQLKPVDLNRMVEQVVELSRARWSDMAQARGEFIKVVLELDEDLPAVLGIESELREALINLVFNSVDAMPGGGTLTLRTLHAAGAQGAAQRRVRVVVSDSGCGMDEDTRRHCLEPFFTTKGERGTGLGLPMVYGVVQRHRAELVVESEPGRGTTVGIVFDVPAESTEVLEQRPSVADLPRLRLLIVDDDPLLIKSLREALEGDGHEVVTADGGQAGIDTFRASSHVPFAAVITDLGMPFVDGRRVSEAVKTASPTTPVILLTGWGQRLVAEDDVPPHVDFVVDKPPRLRELRLALARCLKLGSG